MSPLNGVFSLLKPRELAICRMVCKEWNHEIQELWDFHLRQARKLGVKEAAVLVQTLDAEFELWFVSSGCRLQIHYPFLHPFISCLASGEGLVFYRGSVQFYDEESSIEKDTGEDFFLDGDDENNNEADQCKDDGSTLWVGNPITRVWREVPWPESGHLTRDGPSWSKVELLVDPGDDSAYRIVILAGDSPFKAGKPGFDMARMAFVFDSTRCEWKEWDNSERVQVSLKELQQLISDHSPQDQFVLSASEAGPLEVYRIQNYMQRWFRYVVDVKIPEGVDHFHYPSVFLYESRWILVSFVWFGDAFFGSLCGMNPVVWWSGSS